MEADKKKVEIAKKLIGKKALLKGGGQVLNEVIIVKVKSVDEKSGHAKLFTGDKSFGSGKFFEPLLWSWYLTPCPEALNDLPEGQYFFGEELNEKGETEFVVRKNDCGMFGTIYDCTEVKRTKAK